MRSWRCAGLSPRRAPDAGGGETWGRENLVITSLLAPNADPLFADLASELETELEVSARFAAPPLADRRALVTAGEAHVFGLCGALCVLDEDIASAAVVLAAPVAKGEEGGAFYYTDVVVREESPAARLEDLRGAAWVYNEPASYSGYHAVRAHLASIGEAEGFFGRAEAAGSHEAALAAVARGRADAAPIDSYVLARARARGGEEAAGVRVIARIGPSPAPPIAASRALPVSRREALQGALCRLHRSERGRALLRRHLLERFVPATGADYEPMRAVARAGREVRLA